MFVLSKRSLTVCLTDMAKKNSPTKSALNLFILTSSSKALDELASRLTTLRKSRVCKSDLVREGIDLVCAKYGL